jgi:hypothetical protein
MLARRKRILVAASSIGGAILLIGVLVVVRLAAAPGTPTAQAAAPASSTVVDAIAAVPPAVLDGVGRGTTTALPVRIPTGQPPLTEGGKPLVLYVGAEYCPFCAAQRWGLVVALSRFGTFADLGAAYSAVDDVFPATPTLTFHGSSYSSPYLAFTGVELATSQRRGNTYEPLDTLTPEQTQIMATYDAPPYVPAGSTGAVPFVDFGNRFLMSGSTFSPSLLTGLTHEEIASTLSTPADPLAQAVLGSANAFTAVLCDLTGGAPATVCQSVAATSYQELTRDQG